MRQFCQSARRSFPMLLVLAVSLAFSGSLLQEVRAAPLGITFTVGNVTGTPGSQVFVPVVVSGFSDLSTFQFSFHFDPADATLVDLGPFALNGLGPGNFATNQAANGILTVSWDDLGGQGQTVFDGVAIFAVRLLLTGPIGSRSTVQLDGASTPIEISSHGNVIPLNLITLNP